MTRRDRRVTVTGRPLSRVRKVRLDGHVIGIVWHEYHQWWSTGTSHRHPTQPATTRDEAVRAVLAAKRDALTAALEGWAGK